MDEEWCRRMASLRIAAGADTSQIGSWIEVGRERARQAAMPPYTCARGAGLRPRAGLRAIPGPFRLAPVTLKRQPVQQRSAATASHGMDLIRPRWAADLRQ